MPVKETQALLESCHTLLLAGLLCLFGGQLLWFIAGGTYNALCCRARGQSALAWLREVSFVHLHVLLPPVRHLGRIPPATLGRRFPSAPWWYRAAVLGMATEMMGLLIALVALGGEALLRAGHLGPVSISAIDGCTVVATLLQIWSGA